MGTPASIKAGIQVEKRSSGIRIRLTDGSKGFQWSREDGHREQKQSDLERHELAGVGGSLKKATTYPTEY